MSTDRTVISKAATLTLSDESTVNTPLVVHRETLLGDLPPRDGHDYVLICDDAQKIIGIVQAKEINRRLNSLNEFERNRWSAMPIAAMSKVSLIGSQTARLDANDTEIACAAIREGDNLFGVSINGDMFLSWKRLESLFTAALSDPLTGLMNRLAYERRLTEEWSRSVRTSTSIGVVVVDLDNFKCVNDTYGHAVGDELLSRVAAQLEAAMRSYDVVARFGGDEFVALCLGCSPGDIRIPVTRLIDGLAKIQLKVPGTILDVQASVGAAVRHAGFSTAKPDDLFIAADSCLYEAKKRRSDAWMIEFGCEQEMEARRVSSITVPTEDMVRAQNVPDPVNHLS